MSFPQAITLHGIEEAIQGLGYRNESALKYRLVAAIRELYGNGGEVPQSVAGLPAEKLILRLWEVDDDLESLRSRKKNLSSVKSSVNADLKRLYREGKNPEGITIGPENVFTMSQEARDDLLANLKTGTEAGDVEALKGINETLGLLRAIASKVGDGEGRQREEMGSGLGQLRELVQTLSIAVGLTEERVMERSALGQGQRESTSESSETGEDRESGLVEDSDDFIDDPEGEIPEADPDKIIMDTENGAFPGEPSVDDTDAENLMTSLEEEPLYEFYEEIDGDDSEEVLDADFSGDEDGPEAFAEWGEGRDQEGELSAEEALEIEEELAEAEEEEAEDSEAFDDVSLAEDGAEGTGEGPVDSAGEIGAGAGIDEAGEQDLSAEALEIEEELAETEEEEAEDSEVVEDVSIAEGGAEGIIEGSGEESGEFSAETGAEAGIDAREDEALSTDALEIEEELAETEQDEAAELEAEEEKPEEYDVDNEVFEGLIDAGSGEEDLGLEGISAGGESSQEAAGISGEDGEGVEMEGVLEEAADALELEEEVLEAEEQEPEEIDPDDDSVFDTGFGEGEAFEQDMQGLDGTLTTASMPDAPLNPAAGSDADEEKKARVLAEKFNVSLSAMDRFYNQYLLIPAGEYTIGSGNGNGKAVPARRVRLSEFYMAKFPVTNALFEVFVEKTGYRTIAERVGYGTVYYGRFQRKLSEQTKLETITWNSTVTSKIVPGAFWYQPLGPGSNLHNKRNHPVVHVCLEDAMAFAAWTGKRLPTEEEWEAASRTMKAYLCPWGNRFREDACNMEKSGHGDTTPVDLFVEYENEYGIADTLGNVLEWTTGRSKSAGEALEGIVSFVAKGGSWATAKAVDLTTRTELGRELHSNILGFRCVAY